MLRRRIANACETLMLPTRSSPKPGRVAGDAPDQEFSRAGRAASSLAITTTVQYPPPPMSSAKLLFALAALASFVPGPLLSARTGVVPVKIIVEGSNAASAGEAYVSLVPPERPWSRPTAETIGSSGGVILEVPEGDYRIFAGVRGKGMKISDPITILASRKNEFRVALPALRKVTGTVRDEQGHPVPDATVGNVNAFVEAPLGRISELAARHLGGDWRTQSAGDGTWSFMIEEGTNRPIVAEAAGYATAWLSSKEVVSGPLEIVLRQGAMLRLTFDREAPEYVVRLTAKGEAPAVPASWQAQFWARRVLKTSIEWSSLAAGEYDIYAQQWDSRTFSHMKLGSVTLESGGSRELRLELPRTKAASQTVATVLVTPLARFDAAMIEAFGRDGSGAPRSMPRVSEQVSGGTLLYLDTAGFTAPYFGTTSDRFVVLPVREDGKVPVASVLDLAGASLQIQTASEGLALPINGVAAFHGCVRPETITLPVAVAKGGKVTFSAPAGCMSFVLDFEPFSPVILREQLSLGDPQWLGEFTLYAAGSAAVRVATEDGAGVADAIVSVSVRADEGPQASVPIVERTTGADGWARFDRLPAGQGLAVVARTSDGDRSVIENIRADPTQQRIVDPLRIPKPGTLIIEPKLDPGFIAQFPDGRIQMIFLEHLDGTAERRTEIVKGAERVVFSRMLPGRWQLGALITAGRGSQPLLGEQIEVKAGESKQVEALLEPLVFRGRVTGNVPDPSGNIDIMSLKRSDIVPSVEVFSSGEFVAILPRRDTYFVGVRPRSTGQLIWVGNTPFLDPSQPVEIKLPQGVIVARLRADGKPLAGAMVMARMQYQPTTDFPLIALPVKTGTDGEARIEGLLPGPWIVFVSGNGNAQKGVTVTNTEVAYADLEVKSGLSITGIVMQTFGAPVPDARVTCLLPGPDGVPYIRLAFTGSDGSFEVGDRVPSRSTVLCSVTSFSGAQGYRVVAGDPARLVLPSNPATLRVTSLPAMDRLSGLWLVSRDGRVIDVSPYVPRLPGSLTLSIPALAPEAWKLVRVSSPSEWMALVTGGGAFSGIVDVTLKQDERKTVDLEKAGRMTAPAGK